MVAMKWVEVTPFTVSKSFTALILLLCLSASSQAFSKEQLTFVMQNSHPKYFLEHEKIDGLCGEIYLELKSRLSQKKVEVRIPNELYPIKRILKMVDKGEADAFCGAGRNAKREKIFLYSTLPVYEVSNVMAAHLEDTFNPASFQELADSQALVGALQGTSSSAFLKQHKGVVVDDSFHELNKALEAVARHKKLRFFYYHDLGLNYLVPASGLPLRVVPTKFRSTPQWIIYSKQTPEKLRTLLDDTLREIAESGALKEILKRYFAIN